MSESKSKTTAKRSTKEKTEDTSGEGTTTMRGAGTGVEAPAESTARPPATVVNTDSAPLDPPADSHKQTEPREGNAGQTTDNVYAQAGGRTISGEAHSQFVDQDGNALSVDALFEDGDASKTYVVTKSRIYEEFYYPNTREPARRLLFAQGRRVPRFQADRIKAAATAAGDSSK